MSRYHGLVFVAILFQHCIYTMDSSQVPTKKEPQSVYVEVKREKIKNSVVYTLLRKNGLILSCMHNGGICRKVTPYGAIICEQRANTCELYKQYELNNLLTQLTN